MWHKRTWPFSQKYTYPKRTREWWACIRRSRPWKRKPRIISKKPSVLNPKVTLVKIQIRRRDGQYLTAWNNYKTP